MEKKETKRNLKNQPNFIPQAVRKKKKMNPIVIRMKRNKDQNRNE